MFGPYVMEFYVEESMYIRVNNPTLNKNIGKCNMPTYERDLTSTPQNYKSSTDKSLHGIKNCPDHH